jgi:NADPH:quinone reductase-like Zn-dependent oxidoreductase
VAGTVIEAGPGVSSLAEGDEVWADLSVIGSGALAEFVCAAAEVFAPKPSGVAFDEAATMPHSAVLALQGLHARNRPIEAGQQVLINGAGGCVGPFAIKIAKARGAEVTGVDNTGKLGLMRSAGADHVVDYTKEDITTKGVLFDRILDIATRRSVLDFRRCLAPGGTHAVIAGGLGEFFAAAAYGSVVSMIGDRKMGVFMWKPNDREDLAYLAVLANEGLIHPVIDRRIGLDEVPAALREMQEGRTRGKVVVTVT